MIAATISSNQNRFKRIPFLGLPVLLLSPLIALNTWATVETYLAVPDEPVSQEYSVTVEGRDVPIYTQMLHEYGQHWDPTYSFGSFEFSGRVTVKIHSAMPLTVLTIRPSSSPIPVKLDGNTATFTLDCPGNFVIERNGNGRKDPLLLFANPVETERPKPGDRGVIYYGPGRHNIGEIYLTNNQTLYMAGGAVVTGNVIAHGDNIKILGRGLLEHSGTNIEARDIHMILLQQCTHVRVEGITLRQGCRGWTVLPEDCDGVIISNVKICGSYQPNDDGIDPSNTRNLTVEDCFIRSNDDCLAFKGLGHDRHNCENITVTGTSLWSDLCCILLFGDEGRANYMRNITVKDCHVLYLSIERYPKKLVMLHATEEMRIENLRLENIDVHGDGQRHNYIEMTCEFNQYTKAKVPGYIRNIYLKNVQLTGKPGDYLIVMKGFNEQYDIDGVNFEHCTINDKPIDASSPNLQVGNFAKNISFIE